MRVILRKRLAILALTCLLPVPLFAQMAPGRYNDLIVDQVRQMPQGGRYSASRVATMPARS